MSVIHQQPQDQHRCDAQDRSEDQRLSFRESAGGKRAGARARHARIDPLIEYLVQGGSAGGRERNSEIAPQQR